MKPWEGMVLWVCVGCHGEAPVGVPAPRVEAEALWVSREDGVTLRARGAAVRGDGGFALRGAVVSRGGTWVEAPRVEGVAGGELLFLGGATAGLGTDAGGASTDAGGAHEGAWALSARRIRLDPRRSTLTLEGEVSLRRGALSLEAPRVEVTLDASGAVARAALAGPVTARTATAVLRAPGATVDVGAGVVTLPGPVQLHQAGVALTAGGVTLALNTGALDLTDVRGTLRLGPR